MKGKTMKKKTTKKTTSKTTTTPGKTQPEKTAEPVTVPPVKPAENAAVVIPGLDTVNDFLVSTGEAWNAKHGEIHPVITNRDPVTFPFARFEFVKTKFPGSQWNILKCSDNGREVGTPFKDDSYYVMDNGKLMAFIETLQAGIEKEGLKLTIQTAGTLKDRNNQFISFKIIGLDELEAGGRKINSFLSILKGLDKLMSFTFVNSTITVCCKNTFQMVNDDTGAPLYGKIKFTKNCELKIAEVPLIVRSFVSGNNALLKKLNEWHSIGVNTTQAEQLFSAWLGMEGQPMATRLSNIITRLKELHVKGKGNKGETALDAFNAVTEYYTHESAGDTKDPMKQIESSEMGDAKKSKIEFFDFLVKSLASSDKFTAVCKVGESILVGTTENNKKRAAEKLATKAEKAAAEAAAAKTATK